MVRFIAVKQLQMQIAMGLIGEALKKFPGQTEPESTGHVLISLRFTDSFMSQSVQPPPDQMRPAAEVNDAPGETFVHRYIGLAGKRIARIESRPVAADALFIAEGQRKGLAQGDAT